MELVPAIDLRNGRAVRLYQGVFSNETPSRQSPAQLYARFVSVGARRVHIVDLDGARDGVAGNHAVLRSLMRLNNLRIQTGGGIRELADVVRLLDEGAERVVAGSVAVRSPPVIADWVGRFGGERIVAALDVRIQPDGTPRLATDGWQKTTATALWDQVERLCAVGVKHILCTDIARDGAMAGPNLGLYHECARRFPAVAWQASGGVRDASDLHALDSTGVAAAICGRALIEDRIPQPEMAPFLPAA